MRVTADSLSSIIALFIPNRFTNLYDAPTFKKVGI